MKFWVHVEECANGVGRGHLLGRERGVWVDVEGGERQVAVHASDETDGELTPELGWVSARQSFGDLNEAVEIWGVENLCRNTRQTGLDFTRPDTVSLTSLLLHCIDKGEVSGRLRPALA